MNVGETATPAKLDALQAALQGVRHVLILPHTNPDPDAIASAVALRELLMRQFEVSAQIGYQGVIGRAENRALVQYLGRPLRRVRTAELRQADAVVLVDTQPGAGNCCTISDDAILAIIDHHPLRNASGPGTFVDIRPEVGATSTILMEYLRAAGLTLDWKLATALFYGIKSDTRGLIRGAHAADAAAYLYLQPYIDRAALMEIEQAQVPVVYFRKLNAAIQAAQVYNDVVVVDLGPVPYPDLPAELADLLLRLEGMQWSICLGIHAGTLVFSVRTRQPRGGAGGLVQAVVGDAGTAGGHEMFAGGQVPLLERSAATVTAMVKERMLQELDKASTPSVPLIG